MQKIVIITGGSKGIGLGLVKAYQNNNYRVISIARNKINEIGFENVLQFQVDLSDIAQLPQQLSLVFKTINLSKTNQITLLNNAATLGEIGPLAQKASTDIAQTLQLNTVAPFIITAQFLQFTQAFEGRKRIINIASGAGRNAYYGWSTYCASKAALDMMTQVVALEQNKLANGAKIIAIAPGVVDTAMQGKIRESSPENFDNVAKFIAYKANGDLAQADKVAAEIYAIDHHHAYENGAILHVRDFRNR